MFDRPDDTRYPRSWQEISYDFKLLFGYHICMMLLFLLGGAVSTQIQFTTVVVLLFVIALLSIRHRVKMRWHWPGVRPRDLLFAILTLALGIFLFGSTSLGLRVSPFDSRMFPWFAAGFGIVLFNVLSSLRIVYGSREAFLRQCGDRRSEEPEAVVEAKPTEPSWKKAVRVCFVVYFVGVWLTMGGSFYVFDLAFRDGTPTPTDMHTEALVSRGETVYVTREQKAVVSVLGTCGPIGVLSVFGLIPILHFVVDVKVFPNVPTLSERRERKKGG